MKLENVMICWTPKKRFNYEYHSKTAGMVRLVEYPDRFDRSMGFASTGGACWASIHKMPTEEKTRYLFIEFGKLIIRDGLDPWVVHNTFCEIYEYRLGLSEDMPVPEHLKGVFEREKNREWR